MEEEVEKYPFGRVVAVALSLRSRLDLSRAEVNCQL